jgi:signal transduction histidine kinase
MSDPIRPAFMLEGTSLMASALHAQLLTRRRMRFEHDLKNIMHGLMSGTELLSKALATPTPLITPEECVRLLQQQLKRTQGTLHRMLDELAPAPADAETISLASLIEECSHDLRHELQRFELTTAVESSLRTHAHRALLKDTLLYLLMSAMDAAPPHATLMLTAQSSNDAALVELRFPHADTSFATLGLAVIEQALSGDGAHIELQSRGSETVVTLRLPPAHAQTAPGPPHD